MPTPPIEPPASVPGSAPDPLLVRARALWGRLSGLPQPCGPAGSVRVLVAPGSGLARLTGSAAAAHALAAGLLPQWRARVPASRRVAAALGFRELGEQFGVELA